MTQNDINILRSKLYQVHFAIERLFAHVKDNKEVWEWAIANDLENGHASDLCDMAGVLHEWSLEFEAEFSNYFQKKEN